VVEPVGGLCLKAKVSDKVQDLVGGPANDESAAYQQ